MSSLVLCFLIIHSLPQMLCADYTSPSKEDENDTGEPLDGMQPAKPPDWTSMRYSKNDAAPVQESSPRSLYARGQFSRVWFGSDGIAPASFESMDRDDSERPQDWVGFQEDPYDLDEFASSNLKRRSISDELTSFDRCKQCDDFFPVKPEWSSGNRSKKLKDSLKLKNHEHVNAYRTSQKAKVLSSAFVNSSLPALDRKTVNSDWLVDSYEDLSSVNHLLKLKTLSKPEANEHSDASKTNRKDKYFINNYFNSSVRIPAEKSALNKRTFDSLRNSNEEFSPGILARHKTFRVTDKKSKRQSEVLLSSHLNNPIGTLVGRPLFSERKDVSPGENAKKEEIFDSSDLGLIRTTQLKRSSEKSKKKKAKKERKKFKKAVKDLKRKEPLLSVLYEEAKKNEQAIKILAGSKRKPKSVPDSKSKVDADSRFANKPEHRPIAVRSNKFNPNLDKLSFVQELRHQNNRNSGVFKRGLAVAKKVPSPVRSNLMFSEIFANPIVFTTDSESEDDDEESVTVKVYESALRKGNNSLISDLRFVPNHSEVIKSISQHFRISNSSDSPVPENARKARLKASNVESLIGSKRSSEVFDNNSVFVAENDQSSGHLPGEEADSNKIRARKSKIESKAVVDHYRRKYVESIEPGSVFEANFATKTANSVSDLTYKASNISDSVATIVNNSEETSVQNNTVGFSANVTTMEVSTEKVCNNSGTSKYSENLTVASTESAVFNPLHNLTASIEGKMNDSISGDLSLLNLSDPSAEPIAKALNVTLGAFKNVTTDEIAASSMPNKAETSSAVVETTTGTPDPSKQQVVATSEPVAVVTNHSTPVREKVYKTPEKVAPISQKTAVDSVAPALIVLQNEKTAKSFCSEEVRPTPTVKKNLTALTLEVFTKNPASAAVTSSAILVSNSSAPVHSENKLIDKSNGTKVILQQNLCDELPDDFEVLQKPRDLITPVQAALVLGTISESGEGLYPAAFDEDIGPFVSADPEYKNQLIMKDQTSRPFQYAEADDPDSSILTNKLAPLDYTGQNRDSRDTLTIGSQNEFDAHSDITKNVDEITNPKPDSYPIVAGDKFAESENHFPGMPSLDLEVSPESSEVKYVGKRRLLSYIPSVSTGLKPNSRTEFQSSKLKKHIIPSFVQNYFVPDRRQNPKSVDPSQNYEEIRPILSIKSNFGDINSPSSYGPVFRNTILGPSVPSNLRQVRSELGGNNNTELIASLRPYIDEVYARPGVKFDFLQTYLEPDAKFDPMAVNSELTRDQGFDFEPNRQSSFENAHVNTPDFEPHRKVARRIKYTETDPYHGKHYDDTLRLINPFQNAPGRNSKGLKSMLAQSKCSANIPAKGSSVKEMKQVKSRVTENSLNSSTADPFGVEGPSELDLKIDGIISGKEPNRLVDTILAKVNGCGAMGRELGLGASPSNCYETEYLTMPVSRRESEVKLQAEKMMVLITKELTQLIQETSRKQGCYTLKPDLMNFLRWLLTPAPRKEQTCKDGKICRAGNFR